MAKRKTRRLVRGPHTASEFFDMPERQQELWKRATGAISQMRANGVSLQRAAKDAEISVAELRRLAGPVLRRLSSGRYAVGPTDRLLRVLVAPSQLGQIEVAVRDSRDAATLATYWNAVHRYLETGDASSLDEFDGTTIRTVDGEVIPLITDSATLDELAHAGVLSFESIYARGGR